MIGLELWNKFRAVPDTAKKAISGGRLNGKTDINPMWRIKSLTEQFGPCGFGWKYVIKSQKLETGANDEIAAFVDIDLFIFDPAVGWSEPIPGTGGSMFVAKEKAGPYTSDECYKMALTDALSVACKALGIGADVYWEKDASKYDRAPETPAKAAQPAQKQESVKPTLTADQRTEIGKLCVTDEDKARLKSTITNLGYAKLSDVLQSDYNRLMDQFNSIGLPFEL